MQTATSAPNAHVSSVYDYVTGHLVPVHRKYQLNTHTKIPVCKQIQTRTMISEEVGGRSALLVPLRESPRRGWKSFGVWIV